ncbi:MAG TPA: hypothetical protein VMJ10_29430 [Kofleriaceae bacterium]|nr:hypothetical protein [Kofleriaceae bacterium]
MAASRAAALAALAACVVHHKVTVAVSDLHEALPVMRDTGSATVTLHESSDDHDDHAAPATLSFDQPVLILGKWSPLREVTQLCPAYAPFRSDKVSGQTCPLVEMRDDYLLVREYDTRSTRRAVYRTIGGVALAALVGSVACEAGCRDGSTAKDVSTGALIGLGVLAVGGLVWAIASCVGHGGEPGCRD